MPSCDALVIGAGTNGLACAGALAGHGFKVTVIEAASEPGGAARTVEFAPGYRVSHVAHLLHQLDQRVEKGLDLASHGLRLADGTLPTVALSPSGDHLILEGAFGQSLKGAIDEAERRAFDKLRRKLLRYAALLGRFKQLTPPRLGVTDRGDLATLARLGFNLRRLGRNDMREFLRLILINVADVLEDELDDQRLQGVIAFDTVLGTHMGPRSPNSLLLLYQRLSGAFAGEQAALGLPRGGMGAVGAAMAKAAAAKGARLRYGARVARVTVDNDRAMGVELEGGETISARIVVSGANPKTTFLDLVGQAHLDTGFLRRIRALRSRGNAAKLHLALNALPEFRGLKPEDHNARLVIAPSIDAVERAFNPAKYGEASTEPVMEIVMPSLADPSLAPDGHHVLSAIVQYAPHGLRGGWQAGREGFVKRIMTTLETYAPGISTLVAAWEFLSPADLEARYGLVGGNWHHGELAIEQMFLLRPVAGAAQYSTPLPGLYLCGAGSHPGGGVSGAAGWNAAERIIAMEGRP